MENTKWKIFCILGKSSTGKSTIYNELIRDKKLGLKRIVNYTTRPPRAGEVNGDDYYFVSPEELTALDNSGHIIEKRAYSTVLGEWKYATADFEIDLAENDYVTIGTIGTLFALQCRFGKESIVPIYIESNDCIRLQRSLIREGTEAEPNCAEICRRYLADEEDFSEERLSFVGIEEENRFDNSFLVTCVQKIKEYISATHH